MVMPLSNKLFKAKRIRKQVGHPPTGVREGEGTLESCGLVLGNGSVLTIRPIQ